ncbi:hypothetical protein DICPUDRAFT_37582 [Dictyostelium purpureum]|uniref:TNF receptor-associated factor family protein n=1 Tax=Dictyostelium purpureum TaxID=5786 RepID=F0ZT14_DICPU|nr:uncharacterized protein DICPUDRAFT_37582 [Dictyostelium purpureum]EGC32907.1 hypothetical protein DICPUDRAFT_37582 [Dictyostelium purpureum]|eukprot:XP_003290555.1 hypothetical protein DICPUDRAFT_37582 [Dictyostelium purpureum]
MFDFKISEILVKPLKDDYVCVICSDYVLNHYPIESSQALSCKNGHLMCKLCWDKQLALRKECGICRIKINSIGELCRNIFLEKAIRGKKVYCPNLYTDFRMNDGELVIDEQGCKEIITIDQIETHLAQCEYGFIGCKNSIECKAKFRKNHQEKHEEQCQYSIINCEHCEEPVVKDKYAKHLEDDCNVVSLECEHCHNKYGRRDLLSHIRNECKEVVIDCIYKDGGCNKRIKRCDLPTHLKENNNHIFFMQTLINKHRIETEESDRVIKKLKNDYSELEKRVDVNSRYRGSWTIENWESKLATHNNNERLKSPYFSVGSKNFYIGLYPNGFNDSNNNHFSIFLHLYEKPSFLSTNVKFSFELVNNNDLSKSHKMEKTNIYSENKGSGFGRFIETKLVKDFVTNDKITFNIDVEVIPSESKLLTK